MEDFKKAISLCEYIKIDINEYTMIGETIKEFITRQNLYSPPYAIPKMIIEDNLLDKMIKTNTIISIQFCPKKKRQYILYHYDIKMAIELMLKIIRNY